MTKEVQQINSLDAVERGEEPSFNERKTVYEGVDESQFSAKINLHLENFDGPLDMLLFLVKEAKIEIKDIFISGVTDEFLRYMTELNSIELDSASEYMEMTATLLEIKSKALLPKTQEVAIEDDIEQELIRRIEEYKLMKEASEKLKKIENVNSLYKKPDTKEDSRFVVKDFSIDSLVEAFARVMQKNEINKLTRLEAKEIVKDEYTVEQKIVFLRERIFRKKKISFFELFEDNSSVGEIVVTFSALLQLMKLSVVKAVQTKQFGDIMIEACENKTGSDETNDNE